jgi:hypothetical protein
VGFWKKHPVWAFVVATLVLINMSILPVIISVFQVMMIYGEGDPQLMAGMISEAIAGTILRLIFCLPLIFLFQWWVLRRHRRRFPKVDADKTFS